MTPDAPTPAPPTPAPQAPAPKRVKLTGKVRRGLGLMRRILCEAGDPGGDGTPVHWQLRGLDARQHSDFNQAMAWIEQNEPQPAGDAGQEKTDG